MNFNRLITHPGLMTKDAYVSCRYHSTSVLYHPWYAMVSSPVGYDLLELSKDHILVSVVIISVIFSDSRSQIKGLPWLVGRSVALAVIPTFRQTMNARVNLWTWQLFHDHRANRDHIITSVRQRFVIDHQLISLVLAIDSGSPSFSLKSRLIISVNSGIHWLDYHTCAYPTLCSDICSVKFRNLLCIILWLGTVCVNCRGHAHASAW